MANFFPVFLPMPCSMCIKCTCVVFLYWSARWSLRDNFFDSFDFFSSLGLIYFSTGLLARRHFRSFKMKPFVSIDLFCNLFHRLSSLWSVLVSCSKSNSDCTCQNRFTYTCVCVCVCASGAVVVVGPFWFFFCRTVSFVFHLPTRL